MAWFGPKPCNCGCGDDPPPECACDASDCYPAGKRQFSSIKIEVETDDTWEFFVEEDWLHCSPPCRDKIEYRRRHDGISGLSQFNGTYDAIYYATPLGGGIQEIEDPTSEPCGIWVFPSLTADVYSWRMNVRTFQDDCSSEVVNTSYTDTYSAIFHSRSGNITLPGFPSLSGQAQANGFPVYGSSPGNTAGGPFVYPGATAQSVVTGFDCNANIVSPAETNYSWNPSNGWIGPLRPSANLNMAIGNIAEGNLVPDSVLPDSPPGMRVAHRQTSDCVIGAQEYSLTLPAYSYEWFAASQDACGFAESGTRVLRSKIYWPAKSWTVRAIFNS